eukprot:scaffold28740_cov20-Tisochrysis_lutea.AAC.2
MHACFGRRHSPCMFSFCCVLLQGYDYNNMVFFQWKVPVNNDWVCEDSAGNTYEPDALLCYLPTGPSGACLLFCEKVTKTLTYQRAVPLDRDGIFRLSADYYTCAEWGTSLPQYSWLQPGATDSTDLLDALDVSRNLTECVPFQFLGVKAVINVNRLFEREDTGECVPDPKPTDKLYDRAGGTGTTARAITLDGDGLRGFTKLFTCEDTSDGEPDDIP